MAEENYQKIKLLKIMEILRQETDEDHPMTKAELSARLESMNVSSSVADFYFLPLHYSLFSQYLL